MVLKHFHENSVCNLKSRMLISCFFLSYNRFCEILFCWLGVLAAHSYLIPHTVRHTVAAVSGKEVSDSGGLFRLREHLFPFLWDKPQQPPCYPVASSRGYSGFRSAYRLHIIPYAVEVGGTTLCLLLDVFNIWSHYLMYLFVKKLLYHTQQVYLRIFLF